MDYKVLYRKYRPSCFENIVGQEYTVSMLKNAIMNDKISHAYLFTGPRGTGKTSTAKVFAKTINCENRVNGEACGKCNSCLNFAYSSDIIEIDAASNNGVDDIRELINNIKIAPSESRYKIYVIDEVHMMTQSAFNALLLTLEEPPAHAIFIMATTNVESVPITILSRCQRFNFKKIALDDIVKQLSYVCDKENILIDDNALNEIAYLSEGGLRDALSLLDQLSSDGEKITLDKILENYGSISSVFIKKLVTALENKDIDTILNSMNVLMDSSSDYKVFIKKLVNELVFKAIKCKENPRSSNLRYDDFKNLVFDLNDCMNKISIHINPYLLIQMILLKYISVDKVVNNESSDKIIVKPLVSDSNLKSNGDNQISNSVSKVNEVKNVSDNGSYFAKLKDIRINNCFSVAQKNVLSTYQKCLRDFLSSSVAMDIHSLLEDVSIVVAGDGVAMLSTSLESGADLINHRLADIEGELSTFFPSFVKFIAVSNDEWLKLKQEYIQKLKNDVKYKWIDEAILDNIKPIIDSDLENFATDMFGSDVLQIL